MRKFVFPTTVLVASTLLLAGCHQTPQNGVVATVNGHPIQRDEVDKIRAALAAKMTAEQIAYAEAFARRWEPTGP